MPSENEYSINLMPEEQDQSYTKASDAFLSWATHMGKHLIIIIEAVLLICLGIDFYLSRNLTQLKNQAEDLQTTLMKKDNVELAANQKKLQTDLSEIEGHMNAQIDWQKRLSDVNAKVPENLIIKRIEYTGNLLDLRAEVNSPQGFGLFIQNLINDKNIESITLTQSSYETKTKIFKCELEIVVK